MAWEFLEITVGVGSLKVILGPAKAISQGAKWNVDGGSWLDSGTVVKDLSVGTHVVTCKEASAHWKTPPDKNAVIVANKLLTITRFYYADSWSKRSIRFVWPPTLDPWPAFPPFWWPDFWWEGTELDPWPASPPDSWPSIPPGDPDYADPDWWWNEQEDTWTYPGDVDWPKVAVAGGGRYQSQLIAIAENSVYFEEVS